YGSEKYRTQSGKSIANSYFLQSGTPFIYQGQELGMTSIDLPNLEDYQDVFSVNNYKTLRSLGVSDKKARERLKRVSRGNARTPVQWDDSEYAGFSITEPWMPVNPNYKKGVNAKAEMENPYSVFNHYKALIKFRKENPIVLYGDYKEHFSQSKQLYVYERNYQGKRMLVICSYTEKPVVFKAPKGFELDEGRVLLYNYSDTPQTSNMFITRPYETRVYLFE
ncbi:MAG: glucohydrolase, partial [Eubacterium sp.]